jgi:crossover junction endodeoxyribonuclease RusA
MSITIEIPDAIWLSANQRLHWADKARRTRWVRAMAKSAALHLPKYSRAIVTTWVGYPTDRRADPANCYPTAKAAIDGLIDAGVLPDDDSLHVVDGGYRRDVKCRPGIHTLRLVIEAFNTQQEGGTGE